MSVSSNLIRLAAPAVSMGSSPGTVAVFKTQRIKRFCLLARVQAVLKMLVQELAKLMGREIIFKFIVN